MLQKFFYSVLILVLTSTQSFALEQNLEQQIEVAQLSTSLADAIQVQFSETATNETLSQTIPNSRWTSRLWNKGLPGAKRQFAKKVRNMSNAERIAYRDLFGVQNDADLLNRFEAEVIKEIPNMQRDLETLGVRGYKKKIKAQLKEIEARIQSGETVTSSKNTNAAAKSVDRKIASVSAGLAIVLISLLAVLTVLIVLQIVAVFLLPIVIIAGAIILVTQSSFGSERCTRGGCPSTRRMVGYGR